MDSQRATLADVVRLLGLKPHPEGIGFCETHRSGDRVQPGHLPLRYASERNLGTAIYFTVEYGSPSLFHRVSSDEVWHHYLGCPVRLVTLCPTFGHQIVWMGDDLLGGQRPQAVIPHGTWMGAEVTEPGGWALLGATVCPGFEFEDFELAERAVLLAAFPNASDAIVRLTTP